MEGGISILGKGEMNMKTDKVHKFNNTEEIYLAFSLKVANHDQAYSL